MCFLHTYMWKFKREGEGVWATQSTLSGSSNWHKNNSQRVAETGGQDSAQEVDNLLTDVQATL